MRFYPIFHCFHNLHTHVQEEDTATADGFFDMICKYQSQRLDEQRASLPLRPLRTPRSVASVPACRMSSDDDQLLEMLFKLQHSRLNEQRCDMPSAPHLVSRRCQRNSEHDDEESEDESSSEEEEEGEGEGEDEGEDIEEERRDHLVNLPLPPQVRKLCAQRETYCSKLKLRESNAVLGSCQHN